MARRARQPAAPGSSRPGGGHHDRRHRTGLLCILGTYYSGATLDARALLSAGFAALIRELNRDGRDLPESTMPALTGDRRTDWAAFEAAYRRTTDQVPDLRDKLAVVTLEAIVAGLGDDHARWAHDIKQPPDHYDVAYVRLRGFAPDSAGRVLKAIAGMRTGRPLSGVVLDLRGNGGGSPVEATRLVSGFGHGKVTAYQCTVDGRCETSRADDTTLSLPVRHHLGPDREVIDRIGVPPDHHVPPAPRDAAAGRDPALAKALTLLVE
ncbi:S41 family peptidase [Nonomuraea sp. NPDC049607]|uniref:S41 family peptidase n=1 Tax=Nonomuraea sp. NPDC049607 TaxID=3154732 RepID=UPI003446A5FD